MSFSETDLFFTLNPCLLGIVYRNQVPGLDNLPVDDRQGVQHQLDLVELENSCVLSWGFATNIYSQRLSLPTLFLGFCDKDLFPTVFPVNSTAQRTVNRLTCRRTPQPLFCLAKQPPSVR